MTSRSTPIISPDKAVIGMAFSGKNRKLSHHAGKKIHAGTARDKKSPRINDSILLIIALKFQSAQAGDFGRIFIAPAGKANNNNLIGFESGGLFHGLDQGVRTLQGWQDAFVSGERVESVQRFNVAGTGITYPA